MIERRFEEVNDGFLSGFVGPQTIHDEGNERTETCIGKLIDLIEGIEDLQYAISEGEVAYDEARKAFLKLDNSAQRIIDNVVKAANSERKLR